MHYLTTTIPIHENSHCFVIPILASNNLSAIGQVLNKATGGQLQRVVRTLSHALGTTVVLHEPSGVKATHIIGVSCGDKQRLSGSEFQTVISALATALQSNGIPSICCYLDDFPTVYDSLAWKIDCAIQQFESNIYTFERFKTQQSPACFLKTIYFHLSSKANGEVVSYATKKGVATATGVAIAKNLSNTPANHATPSNIAHYAQQLAQTDPTCTVTVHEIDDPIIRDMGAFKAVSQGSNTPAKFVVIQYQPTLKQDHSPIVLIGKGVTFDTGGISIKPAQDMEEMKFDMAGAASVLGTIKTLSILKAPINVIGLLPLTENLLNGAAMKPGDVVTTLSGKTVEIINTDAEGRLILADALTYSRRFNPAVVIDIATLTGAVVAALGEITSGLMTTNPLLRKALEQAGEISLDRVWTLPLFEEYQASINSNVADIANLGDKGAGSITAACFLSRFTEGLNWAHLDIAGTAWVPGRNKSATGRPVPLLVQYIVDYCSKLANVEA